jgi:Clathrin light chain
MSEDDNFFAMPPAEAPPAESEYTMESDYAAFGEAPPADDYADMGFAAAGAPEEYDAFAGGDAPIILGAPPPEPEDVMEEPLEAEPAAPLAPMEPSVMQKWNEAWQITLNERKQLEDSKQVEMEAAAKVFIEQFQADKEAKREGKMAKNREDEQAKLEAIEADLENDNSWQRACKMVELSHNRSHEGEDVKKMRDILILLKSDAARASAVGA